MTHRGGDLERKYPWAKFVLDTGTIVPHRVPFPLARRFQQICATFLAQVYAQEVMNEFEYAPLACVDDFPGIDQTRLAKLVGIDRTSAGQAVDMLEARGLLVRRPSQEDRRVRLLTATSKGRAMRQQIRPKVLAAQDRMLASLSVKERTLLMDLLVRVIEANEVHARPGAGRRPPIKKKNVATNGEPDGSSDRYKTSSRSLVAGKRPGRSVRIIAPAAGSPADIVCWSRLRSRYAADDGRGLRLYSRRLHAMDGRAGFRESRLEPLTADISMVIATK